ncbi:UDP-N-acetylmuramoyl-L-alanyl-D-glutamate--2,6-diaminopimelate ligase, partial [Paenibacillus sepulcri]|nr:UDP-N-acetylmuramoyl-L-alanyl-D-glutamate--2,6-diaminopimelate ligase [Paenibacillus sepulcri]
MRLEQIAELLLTARLIGDKNTQINGIQIDSRKVSAGDLFICLPGHTQDGHDFAPQAMELGASALVVDRELPVGIPQILVKDCRLAMAVIADIYFEQPSHKLKLIGVTGTNGKTTTTYLIERILADAGFSPGVIGTVEMRYGGRSYPMSGTT